jgi:hypothetical protein
MLGYIWSELSKHGVRDKIVVRKFGQEGIVMVKV